jgi:hypothetical protein
MTSYTTPVDAVLAGFPPGSVRVVAWAAHDTDAYVLLDTGSQGQRYLYGVNCHRGEDGWEEGGSGNCPGWTAVPGDDRVGTLVLWNDAPAGADRARVAFGQLELEVPVSEGVYLAAWWRVPEAELPRAGDLSGAESLPSPRAVEYRIDVEWVPANG